MRKLLFIRHGESTDDLENQYGGWADFELTQRGIDQTLNRIPDLNSLNISFDKVLTSPLRRAKKVGEIISKELSIPLETFEYAIEMNGYGILSGMNKDDALRKYPELVEALKDKKWIVGSETVEQRNERVRASLEVLRNLEYENAILVTHGGFSSRFCDIFLGKKIIKIGDLAYFLIDIQGNMRLLEYDGIEFEN